MIVYPLGDGDIGVQLQGIGSGRCLADVALHIRQQDGRLAGEGLGHMTDGDCLHLIAAARGGQFAAHGIQPRRPALARTGNAVLLANIDHQRGDGQCHDQHDEEGHQILRVGNREGESWRDEEEVEAQRH